MTARYNWVDAEGQYALELVHVRGTNGSPYPFGEPRKGRSIALPDFLIATVPVTQALWSHVMGPESNPAVNRGGRLPVENVSWDALTETGGFLERINAHPLRRVLAEGAGIADLVLRLASETEWEYAARGGPHWTDGYTYSGGNDIDTVAWYDRRHGDWTQPVALKTPNQLGLYDMSGNIWEWCQDVYTPDPARIPADGTPCAGEGLERVLRGGCFHNWAMHCTVWKRYEIARDFHDGCIGFRLVGASPRLAAARNSVG